MLRRYLQDINRLNHLDLGISRREVIRARRHRIFAILSLVMVQLDGLPYDDGHVRANLRFNAGLAYIGTQFD